MVKHIVMWTIKKNTDGSSREEILKILKVMLEGLKESIPAVQKLEVGFNFNPSESAYDIALYSEFRNRDDLEIYQKHPDHIKVAEFVGSVREHRTVVDYEV
jgi:hypothetical protein